MQDDKQVPDDITTTDSIVPTDELISFGESASSMNKADNPNLENGKIHLNQSLLILKKFTSVLINQRPYLLFYRLNKPKPGFDKGY